MTVVKAWNKYCIVDGVESGRIVCATNHSTDIVTALNEAETYARNWNAKETRPNMLVTLLSCNGFVRTV